MKIFEYPYIIITIFVICFLTLGAVGLYFAHQGVKTAKNIKGIDFSSIYKLENIFDKLIKLRKNPCVIYISISLDNVRSMISSSKANRIFSEIKPVLLSCFSIGEGSAISLYDGNNFAALTTEADEKITEKIEKCKSGISSILLKHHCINNVGIVFGYYTVYTNEINLKEAIVRAREACTAAKKQNVSYMEWSSRGRRELENKIKIENSIVNELENNRFFLEYQPFVSAADRKIIGAEVLARLNSEKDGIITPGNFLDAVHSNGLNDKFDYYIFEKNCKWISNNKNTREKLVYTVNFSRKTLSAPEFYDNIISIVEKYELNPSCLAVEVLEDKTVSEQERENMRAMLSKMRNSGFEILLDDFGSGYTAFADLNTLNITAVKIDKAIVQKADTESGFLVLKNIIRTAKELGYQTVCEGIETQEQEELAVKAGCDILQGFYYYRPMSAKKIEELII